MWFFKQALLLCYLPLNLCPGFETGTAQNLTNYQLLAALTDSLLVDAISKVVVSLPRHAVVKSLQEAEGVDWFLQSRLVKALEDRKVEYVYLLHSNHDSLNVGDNAEATWGYEFKVLTIGVSYFKIAKNMETITRQGRVEFLLRIINKLSGEIVFSRTLTGTKSDWIPIANVAAVENAQLGFTRGEMKSPPSKNRLIQPILITTVTGVIAYLFYSLRSR
jgi:hypothetical protein